MLTKYTLDTNDEDLTSQAIELRKRFAGRKLQDSLANGNIDDKLLIKFKDMNRNERVIHGKEVVNIMNRVNDGRTALVRTEQQLEIQSQLRSLGNDITRSTRLNKAKVDALTDLEKRIIHLRQNLNDPQQQQGQGVEHVMIDQLTVNNKLHLMKLFKECSLCHRKVLSDLYEAHAIACKRMNGETITESRKPVYDVDCDLKTSLTSFLPQPPRNCQLIQKGYRYMSFIWEPPVFDGGLPITNYEISYKTHSINLDPGTKMKIVKVKEQPLISTSQWFYRNPINHNGFKVTGLEAGQSYVDFRIRSVNLRGVSEWVDLIPASGPNIISTMSPVEPWEPLFVHISKVTSSCIYLDWEPPFFDGGNDIIRYEIKYTVFHRTLTSTDRAHVTPKEYTLKTSGPITKFVIRNLPSSTKIESISICAVNQADLKGKKALVTWGEPVNHTQPCSRFYQIQQEIQRVQSHIGEFIDSDFYTGVAQKLYKKDYLEKLKKDLPQHTPTEEEKEETVEWNKIVTTQLEKKRIEELTERALAGGGDSDDDDDADGDQAGGGGGGGGEYVLQNGEMKYLKKKKVNPNSFIFSFKIRKKHYQLKLERIEKLMKESEQEQVAIDINRVKYTTLLHEKQRRVIEIQSEIDRVVNFNGLEIVSSVLQGVEMTYLTMTLKSLLQTTWMTLLQEISLTKHEVIIGEKKKKEIVMRLQSLQLEKQERKAKMINFLNEYEKQQRIMTNLVNGSSRFSLLKIHFEKLKQFQKLQKEMKKNIREAFVTCSRRFLKSAFEKWLTGKFSQDDDGATSGGGGGGGGTSGVGTRLLHKTRLLREEMQSSLRQELAQTFQIKKQLTLSTSYSLQQQSKFISSDLFPVMEDGGMNSLHLVIDEGMKFLYEGDGYVTTSQYHQAESCYDAQIILLRSRLPLKIKYLAICHGRLGKLYLRQERYDRAIVEFDRQMSLGNEIGDKVEIADAYYGLGTGYFSLLEYQESIRYLEIASSRYETLGNIPKYCGCLYLLKDCYQRLNKVDLMELYLKKVKEVEGELHEKMRRMHQKLEKMTGQLRLNSAVFELEVKIERSSPRILFLKHELDVCHEKLLEEQEVLADQQQICHGVEELLDAIQRELEISKTTEELEMMSYLVHDQPQMVNVEEVKTRLHKRRVEILEKYRAEKEIELGIVTRIKNLEHAIEVHDEEVSIELGDLMRKVKNNRPFRVIAFNPANAASDEVTGTATGGVENFISAESSNIHVIDYHNGELLHVYSGDSRSRLGEKLGHIGVITCLAYDQNRIYSGGADELIMVWDHMSHQRVMVLTGHEGSIVSLAVHGFMLMSGGADATIRLWDKGTGRELRIIHGHSESVLSIDLGANWMVTASSDEEVRVWEIKEKSRHTIKVDTKFRLQGHGTAVTVAKYGKLEVVSGDKKGDIIVWWVETGAIVQHIKGVHTGRVNCLQFDATRIVSGGADNNVCITDIGTGRILQTLRGHTGQVLCLSFDTERIISASRDSTLRYWKWGDKRYQPADKYHMMAPTDSLPLIAKTYELELETLMKWNGLRDVKDSYPGMRLIVRKANPDQLTKAELLEFEKQRKRLKGIEQTDKKIRQLQMESGSSSLSLQQHSRVHKIATDIDPYSIGNRMFHQQKINSELFPEKTDLFVDHQSLGSRIRANTGKRREFGGPVVKILTTKANENEWGAISDELAMSILESFIEFQAYELVTEEKKKLRDGLSVLGRMNMTRQQKAMNTKLLMGVGSKANRKKGKREKIEKAMALWSDPIGEEGEGEGGEGGKGGEGGGDEEKEEKRRKRREQREKDKRERRERKEKERKEREGKGTEGGGGAGGEGGEGSHPSAPSSVNENEHSEEERGSASEDEDEEEEEERDRIFNRKKHRKDKDQSSGPQPSDIHLGDDHSSEAGEGEGEGGDYGLVLNKRKGSSSSNVSKGSQESSGGTGTGGGDDEATTAAKAKAARKALRGEGDEKEGDEEEERKSQSSRGGAPPSSLTSSRRGSNQSETAASARARTPTEANGSRLRLSQQQRQQQQQQERLRRSSASSTGSGQGQRQPSSSSVSASVSSSLQGSSIQVDDEDADLLSLLKKDNGAGRRGGGQQGQMDDDDDCDY